MTPQELLTALLGSLGCLVLSLLLNYAFLQGWIMNPKKAIPREDYEVSQDLVKSMTKSFETLSAEARKRSKTKVADD